MEAVVAATTASSQSEHGIRIEKENVKLPYTWSFIGHVLVLFTSPGFPAEKSLSQFWLSDILSRWRFQGIRHCFEANW